jgi:hypothetical protein
MTYPKSALLSLVLVASMPTAKPISENAVYAWSGGSAVVVGSLTAAVIHYNQNNGGATTPSHLRTIIGGSLAGLATGALVYYILNQYTPNGHFSYAYGIINSLASNSLINMNLDNADNATARIARQFGTSWSLILARESLTESANLLNKALSSLQTAHNEAILDPAKYPLIIQGYPGLLHSGLNIHPSIERVLTFINNHPRYDQQVAMYERHKEEKARRAHEKEIAAAKSAHKSTESKLERDYRREENEKDRALIAGHAAAAPVRLNMNLGGR